MGRLSRIADQVKISLDETRMLVMGVQIFLGFGYSAVLAQGFDSLPATSQQLKLVSHSLLLVAFALLVLPSAQHQIVNRGRPLSSFVRFVSKVSSIALLPFALALSIDIFVASGRIVGTLAAALIGAGAFLLAIFYWYGIELVHRSAKGSNAGEPHENRDPQQEQQTMQDDDKAQSAQETQESQEKDKIDYVLTETRIVLPGAQALLGFQLASILVEGFDKLPEFSKYVHLASMLAVAVATVLLIAPAAYHRLAEQGRFTEHFYRVSSRMLLSAMAVLALGISGDFYVVATRILESQVAGLVFAVAALALFYGVWFGFTNLQKRAQPGPSSAQVSFASQDKVKQS